MSIFILLAVIGVMGCQTADPQLSPWKLEQQRAAYLWRLEHPNEAAKMDAMEAQYQREQAQINLMRAQAAREDAQAAETYSNMFRPRYYQPSQPQPMPRRSINCNTMNMGNGMTSTNCW